VKSVVCRKSKGERQRDEDRDVLRKEKNILKKEKDPLGRYKIKYFGTKFEYYSKVIYFMTERIVLSSTLKISISYT
jgi:hypothetical protein